MCRVQVEELWCNCTDGEYKLEGLPIDSVAWIWWGGIGGYHIGWEVALVWEGHRRGIGVGVEEAWVGQKVVALGGRWVLEW